MTTSPWTPAFSRFFLAQSLSWMGSSMTPVALSFGFLQATGRADQLALVLASNSAPMALLLVIGGTVAVRVPRGRLLVVSHAAAGSSLAGVAAWFANGAAPLWILVVLAAANGAAAAFTGPALRGIVAELVPDDALERANAARAGTRNVFRLVGPGGAGVLVATAGPAWAVGIDAGGLLAAALLLTGVRTVRAESSGGGFLGDLHEGWREFRSRTWLWSVTLSFFGANFLIGAGWLVLGPVTAHSSIGATGWGLVLGIRAAGQILGGSAGYWWVPNRPLVLGQLLTLPLAGVLWLLAIGASLPWLLIGAFVHGVGSALAGVLWESTLQRQVPREALSRIASIDMLGSFVSVPLGQLAAPVLAAQLGMERSLVAMAVACVFIVAWPLGLRSARELRSR